VQQDEQDEPESLGFMLLDATGNLVAGAIEENRRARELEGIMQIWYGQQKSEGEATVKLHDYTIGCSFPLDTSGQAALKVLHPSGAKEYIYLIMKDGWYSRGQIQTDQLYHFSLTAEEIMQWTLDMFSYMIGVEVSNLDSIPLYESMRMNSAEYKKYLQKVKAGEHAVANSKWPQSLSGKSHKVMVYRRTVPYKEIRHATRRGFYGKTYKGSYYEEWSIAMNHKASQGLVATKQRGDKKAIFSKSTIQIGESGRGFYQFTHGTFWWLIKEHAMMQ
jgi:hypothetical protein